MGAKLAKSIGTCACWLAMLGTTACEGSWGDGSYGTTCYTERTCDEVVVLASGAYCGDPSDPIDVEDGNSARCVLEQLRDGNTGQVVINVSSEGNVGYCGTLYEAHIISGRRAVVVEYDYFDLGAEAFPKKAFLKSPEEYQGCLDDGPARYAACLVNAFDFHSGETTCECDYCHPE